MDKNNKKISIKDKAEEYGVPVIPPLPKEVEYPKVIEPNPVVAVCGECGMKIHQVMGYCCGNNRCPVQPKVFSLK